MVLDLPYPLLLRRTAWRTLLRGLTGAPCCNGNRESPWRLLHRDGVLRYLVRTWHKRHRRHAGLAAEPALAHTQVLRLCSRADALPYHLPLAPALAASVDKVWAARQSYYQALGPPLSLRLVDREVKDSKTWLRYRVKYTDTVRLVRASFDAQGLIEDVISEDE